jgi:hypothetical protein
VLWECGKGSAGFAEAFPSGVWKNGFGVFHTQRHFHSGIEKCEPGVFFFFKVRSKKLEERRNNT